MTLKSHSTCQHAGQSLPAFPWALVKNTSSLHELEKAQTQRFLSSLGENQPEHTSGEVTSQGGGSWPSQPVHRGARYRNDYKRTWSRRLCKVEQGEVETCPIYTSTVQPWEEHDCHDERWQVIHCHLWDVVGCNLLNSRSLLSLYVREGGQRVLCSALS